MGIKGIYGEIGSGRRVALAKLSADKLKETKRPLRIAIDISIWLFQVQSGQGGANPAIRTLYYRLVRLLSLNIQPLFVFDGPNKPPFKRNAKTANGGQILCRHAKRLLDLFAFPHLTAPGEAEAECAVLQRHSIVDYVLSEDVDTLAFGCTATMRNWSGINERGNHTPTHVNVFEVSAIKEGKSRLDREGMVLIALMSGGDYIPAGIPRCGIKLACEAARAGFGHDLCKLDPNDEASFKEWRERLIYELKTNESGFFRTRHKALEVPESFPDRTVLGYHAQPDVSGLATLQQIKENLQWTGHIDIKGLRDFVDEEFEWRHLSGAKKFLRNLAPALLAHRLYQQAEVLTRDQSLEQQTELEERLVLSLTSRRQHFSTDGVPEIKVGYIPGNIVGLDLDNESTSDLDGQDESSSDEDAVMNDDGRSRSRSPTKRSKLFLFDPWKPTQTWIMETIVSLGAPLSLEQWNTASEKVKDHQTTVAGGMRQGDLISYLRVTKPGSQNQGGFESRKTDLPDPYELKARFNVGGKGPIPEPTRRPAASKSSRKKSSKTGSKTAGAASTQKPSANPWTLARKEPDLTAARRSSTEDGPTEIREDSVGYWYHEEYDLDGTSSSRTMVVSSSVILQPTTPSQLVPKPPQQLLANSTIDDGMICSRIFRERSLNLQGRKKRNDSQLQEHGPQFEEDQLPSHPPAPSSTSGFQRPGAEGLDHTSLFQGKHKRSMHVSAVTRESLEGTWKMIEDFDNLFITTRRQYPDVDVLDLTDR